MRLVSYFLQQSSMSYISYVSYCEHDMHFIEIEHII